MLEITVKFEQACKSYTSKDVIAGEATIVCSRETTVTSIKIACRGFAYVTSSRTGGSAVEEIYWNSENIVFTPQNNEKLPAGTHKYPFSFTLPDDYFPTLPASFAYKRDASGNGIRWLIRCTVAYPKIKLRRSQAVEKPFLFFPQYNPKKFSAAVPYVTYEFEDTFKGSTHHTLTKEKQGLRSKLKNSVFGGHAENAKKKEVSFHCNIITAKQGVSQAPFSSGVNLQLWASERNFVLLEEVVLTLLATQQLHYASVTEESKFKVEIARLRPEGGEVLPDDPKDPITLVQLLKAHTNRCFVLGRNLPGTFESKYFGQSYVLQAELKVASFYNRQETRTFTFEQPVEVLHLWVCPDAKTVPTATFLASLDAQLGLPEGPFDHDEGLPAYPGYDSPPNDFGEYDDITPVTSLIHLDGQNHLAPMTSIQSISQ